MRRPGQPPGPPNPASIRDKRDVHIHLALDTGYDFWFAQYNSRNQPDMYYNYRIWQYTDSGTVPGIEGKVDMDIAFIPY